MDQQSVIWEAAQCGYDGWAKIWGDPWLSGTLMVAAYALSALLLFRITRQLSGRERALWITCGLLMTFQAINTPLDLHAFVWTFGKCLAKAQGWYGAKDLAKSSLLVIALVIAAIATLSFLLIFRKNLLSNLLLIFGTMLALSMTALEAINLGAISAAIQTRLGPFFAADWLELSGAALTAIAVIFRRRKLAKPD